MVTGVAGAKPLVHRVAPNVRWLALADAEAPATEVFGELHPTTRPSEALHAFESAIDRGEQQRPVNAIVAKLELDVCGAWLTIANGCVERPVVIRRAGWVDLRGHPGQALGGAGHPPADDRVGLG